MRNYNNFYSNEDEGEIIEEVEMTEIEALQLELSKVKEQYLRDRADMDNQRKRMDREMDNARKFALQDFLTRLLPAKDNIERGLDLSYVEDKIDGETLFEGMTSSLNICNSAFKASGIEEINPIGEAFDPELHEAMTIKKVEGKNPNIVLSVYQKGYLLNNRLVRAARVEVSA